MDIRAVASASAALGRTELRTLEAATLERFRLMGSSAPARPASPATAFVRQQQLAREYLRMLPPLR